MVSSTITYFAESVVGKVGPELAELCGLVGSPWERELHRPFRIIDGRTTGVSTCGLVAEGIWHESGVIIPQDWRPYKPSLEREKSIARAIGFASRCRALRVYDGSNEPEPGDYVVIGSGYRTHALTCLSIKQDELESVDGGQVCPSTGLQMIKRRVRKIVRKGKDMFVGDGTDMRRVEYWIDVDELPSIWAQEVES